ncbi:MAG: twin-arginine translocation pathway signal protein [Alphaproteobacteria bacterium]|nr:twin-arginine translocation pathway signal protein [Alphaproteobacteria bacterium]
MSSSRRRFLQILGSSAVILAAAGTGFVMTREPVSARAPWRNAGQYPDPMRRALSWAILAPNPHNRQPWIVDLISETEAVLYCDPDRRLPATDPYDRQITIGLGCFLELFRQAAAEDGLNAGIEPFPDGGNETHLDARPVARLQLTEGAMPDPLFAFALDRHTNRNPYDTDRPVPQAALDTMTVASGGQLTCGYSAGGTQRDRLRSLCWAASEIEQTTARTWQESLDLMRIGKREINANPDGIAIPGASMEILNGAGLFTRTTLGEPGSIAYQQSLDMQRGWAETAMAFFWMSTEGNSRLNQLVAGRGFLRAALAATQDGLVLQPMSQSLQEYPEMAALYEEVHRALAPEGHTLQMLVRLGYARAVAPSPRWPMETRLRQTV